MFKVGDKVKFKKSSINTGMIDATEDDVFEVSWALSGCAHIQLRDVIHSLTGWWNVNHFEHAEEEIMNNTEEQEIDWEVGQEVWDVRYGKGVVDTMIAIPYQYPIGVVFADGGTASYTSKGLNRCTDVYRSLFFSEPKIEAEKFPTKKPFTPVFYKGDTLVAKKKDGQNTTVFYVEEETDISVKSSCYSYAKDLWNFYKISEKVEF